MQPFALPAIRRQRAQAGRDYQEFLRVPSMSAGVYELAAGAEDRQQPHTEDELYYVVAGRASLRVDGEDVAMEAGSLAYVPARVEHRFHNITEDLTILVFFAPAEYTAEART
jgi:mannose-6-phosphate isomerase-like protein (cupin superfamily)